MEALPSNLQPVSSLHGYANPSPSILETKKRLIKEKFFSALIPEPDVYGSIADEMAYINTFRLLMNATLETEHRVMYFSKLLSRRPILGAHLLEVGCGNGSITQVMANAFSDITIVDVNQYALDNIPKQVLNYKRSVKTINQSITDLQLQAETYDFVSMSHVLYYVHSADWMPVLDKVYGSLKPGGKVAIVLSSDLDKSGIINYFNGKAVDLDAFVDQCNQKYEGQLVIDDILEECVLYTKRAAMLIAGFYLCDGNATASAKEISTYINSLFIDGAFRFRFKQRFVLIEKTV